MSSLFKPIRVLHLDSEGLVDPKEALSEKCLQTSACQKFQKLLDDCSKRVEEGAHETCVEEFFKLQKCIDHCVQPKLFKYLK